MAPPRAPRASKPGKSVHRRTARLLNYEKCATTELLHFISDRKRARTISAVRAEMISALCKADQKAMRFTPLSYDEHTTDELWCFIQDRNLREVEKILHDVLVRGLKKAGRSFKFRFMDLAGELQNQIYENLLSPHSLKTAGSSGVDIEQVCYPQILATCKKIHNDASKILYDTFSPRIHRRGGSSRPTVYIQGRLYEEMWPGLVSPDWPLFLLKVKSVTIFAHDGLRTQYLEDQLQSFGRFLKESSRPMEVVACFDERKTIPFGIMPFMVSLASNRTYVSGDLCKGFERRFLSSDSTETNAQVALICHAARPSMLHLLVDLLQDELDCLEDLSSLLTVHEEAELENMRAFIRTAKTEGACHELDVHGGPVKALGLISDFLDRVVAVWIRFEDVSAGQQRRIGSSNAFKRAEKLRQEFFHSMREAQEQAA